MCQNIYVKLSRAHGVWKSQKKISLNISSEASYVYILSGQKFIKNGQKCSILTSFWKPEACGQTVLPDWSVLIGQKLVENAKIQKFKCDILCDFQTLCWSDHNDFFLQNNSIVNIYVWLFRTKPTFFFKTERWKLFSHAVLISILTYHVSVHSLSNWYHICSSSYLLQQ